MCRMKSIMETDNSFLARRYGRSTVNLAYVELLRHNRKIDEREQKNKDQSQSRQHEKMDRGQEQKKKRQEMGL